MWASGYPRRALFLEALEIQDRQVTVFGRDEALVLQMLERLVHRLSDDPTQPASSRCEIGRSIRIPSLAGLP